MHNPKNEPDLVQQQLGLLASGRGSTGGRQRQTEDLLAAAHFLLTCKDVLKVAEPCTAAGASFWQQCPPAF